MPIRNTIIYMALGILAMRILEVMFFIGMAGSALVVLTTFVRVVFYAILKPETQA